MGVTTSRSPPMNKYHSDATEEKKSSYRFHKCVGLCMIVCTITPYVIMRGPYNCRRRLQHRLCESQQKRGMFGLTLHNNKNNYTYSQDSITSTSTKQRVKKKTRYQTPTTHIPVTRGTEEHPAAHRNAEKDVGCPAVPSVCVYNFVEAACRLP